MTSQEDKPFSCPIPGCGQCFANSDHLAVHQAKHELSLKFGNKPDSVVDQTPTPTRFLKNVEESGLFDELQTNPFDQDFRQAAARQKGSVGITGITTTPSGISVTPTTPIRIQIPGSNYALTVPMLTSQLVNNQLAAVATAKQAVSTEVVASEPDGSGGQAATKGTDQPCTISEDLNSSQGVPKIPVAPLPSVADPDKEVPKATAPLPSSNASPTIVRQKLREALQKKVASSPQFYKAPYITIPATPEILQQALSTVLPGGAPASVPASMGAPTGMPPPVNQTITISSDDGMDTMVTGGTSLGDAIVGGEVIRKRRKYSSDANEEPEVKRQRFLERNRAAASRCRQKKKVWVEGLEKKSKDLEVANNQLQNEVTFLRNEVHQLKTILLAHKDCPLIISQQQQIARIVQQIGSDTSASKLPASQHESYNSFNSPQAGSLPVSHDPSQLEKLVGNVVNLETAKAEQ